MFQAHWLHLLSSCVRLIYIYVLSCSWYSQNVVLISLFLRILCPASDVPCPFQVIHRSIFISLQKYHIYIFLLLSLFLLRAVELVATCCGVSAFRSFMQYKTRVFDCPFRLSKSCTTLWYSHWQIYRDHRDSNSAFRSKANFIVKRMSP
jgi:hypothetical protein